MWYVVYEGGQSGNTHGGRDDKKDSKRQYDQKFWHDNRENETRGPPNSSLVRLLPLLPLDG